MKKLLILLVVLTNLISTVNAKDVSLSHKIVGLYVAFFNRAADKEGLDYWTKRGDSVSEQTIVLKELAAGFATHPSFDRAYGALNNQAFVKEVYKNALGREGDAAGIAYWSGRLDLPISSPDYLSRSDFVAIFVDAALTFDSNDPQYVGLSAEELYIAQLRHDLLANKVEAGLAFTNQLGELSNVKDNSNPETDRAYLASIKIISEVTEEHRTVEDVLILLNSIINMQDPIGEILNSIIGGTTIALSLITDIGDINLSDVLSPSRTSVLKLNELKEDNISITLDTTNDTVTLFLDNIVKDENYIRFTAPKSIIDGNLTIKSNGLKLLSIPYSVVTIQTPYITEITPSIVHIGDMVEINGTNLPLGIVEVVLQGQQKSISKKVNVSNDSFHIKIPQEAKSGTLYLRINGEETNRLPISIKKYINAKVILGNGLDLNASSLSFIRGLKEYILDSDYNVVLPIENKTIQYLNLMVNLKDDNGGVLYSAVILPDMENNITIDANSTALSWIFMGMGIGTSIQEDELRSIYDRVVSNIKVQEFANYIDTLQKNDLNSWLNLSDSVLISKYQEALQDVLQEDVPTNKTIYAREIDDNTVLISQEPMNEDILVDDYIYNLNTLWKTDNKLNNGTVNVINDTRLFLSVEVRDKKTHKVINGYHHLNHPLDNYKSLIVPKGWSITGFSSLNNLNLQGKDATIQIVVGSSMGSTSKEQLARGLGARVFVEGIISPSLNILITTLIDRQINNSFGQNNSLGKRVVSALSDVYGTSFWVDLMEKFSNNTLDISASGLVTHFVTDPIKSGLDDCITLGFHKGKCEQTAKAILELVGVGDTTDAGKKMLSFIATNIGKTVFRNSLKAIPYYGQILAAADFVYNHIGQVSDAIVVAESLYDRKHYPKEINVNVDFPLEVSKVTPLCVALSPSDTLQSFYIDGKGFSKVNDKEPSVFIGSGDDKSEPYHLSINEDATQMEVNYRVDELIDEGSWEGYLFVKHLGVFIMYDKIIRIISTEDDKIYFDSIVPNRGILGQTVVLNGCGWIPLSDIKVYFTSEDGETEAEIISKTIDNITVKIPLDAKSGFVYVKVGEKETRKIFFGIIPFGLFSVDRTTVVDETEIGLSGIGLSDTSHVYFIDHNGNKWEGDTRDIRDTTMLVKTPLGMPVGSIKLYVVLSDGTKSNELILNKVPERPTADPMSGTIGDGLLITISKQNGSDIYYKIDEGYEHIYNDPIHLTLNDMTLNELTLYAFVRETIDGVDYDSDVAEFYYYPCEEGDRYANHQCLPPLPSCPKILDQSMVEEAGDRFITIGISDDNNDGDYESYIDCVYYDNDKLQSETPMDSYKINGIEKIYYESGQIRAEESFTNGIRDGQWVFYYENGNIKSIWIYNNGKKDGIWKTYYESGQLYTEKEYDNDKATGSWRTYLESGILLQEENYMNGLKNGVSSSYDRDTGILRYKCYYSDGMKDGMEVYYYPSGAVKSKVPYTSDKRNGVAYYYRNEDGSVWDEVTYTNDSEQMSIHWINGVKDSITYQDGSRRWHTVWFFTTGEISHIIHYLGSRKDGREEIYEEDGTLEVCKIWENGVNIGSCMP